MSENSTEDLIQEILSPGSLSVKKTIRGIVDEIKKTNDVLDRIIKEKEAEHEKTMDFLERIEQDIIILKEEKNA